MWGAFGVFACLRREMLKHFCYALVQILYVLVRLIRQGVTRRSAPDHRLGFGVKQVDHQRAYGVSVFRSRCRSELVAPATPAPVATKVVVVGVERLMVFV